jgi:23S rRNA pseudouridine2605 synthase
MPSVRLNKHLADQGLASRRGAEALILGGQVRVNGAVVTELATKVDPAVDTVTVEAQALKPQGPVGYLLNKPVGYVTTKGDGEGPNIIELLPPPARGMSYAGRLDKDSRGLVLMLADGRISYKLTAPETHLEKEYEVMTETEPASSQLEKMAAGLTLKDGPTRPCKVEPIRANRFRMVITEGRNRQIRRMCSRIGLEVVDLRRVRVGPLRLGSIVEGAWRELRPAEEAELKRVLGLAPGAA